MNWSPVPFASGADQQAYAFLQQFHQAVRERNWAAGNLSWPQGSFVWASGTITSVTPSGNSYVIGHAGTITLTSGTGNPPANYDLIIDDLYNPDQVIHVPIISSTGSDFTVDDNSFHVFDDLATGGWFYPNMTGANVAAAVSGRTFYVIRRNGIWWNERWPQWPNDQEKWVGTGLAAGARQIVTSLTSSGTTATAIVPNHQFNNGENVTIAGAASSNNRFNGTFPITLIDANTFSYTLGGTDDATAAGAPTALNTAVGAHDDAANYPAGAYASGTVLLARRSSDTRLQRITLTGNTPDSLIYARQTFQLTGQYAVMPTNNVMAQPSRYRIYSDINTMAGYNVINADANPHAAPWLRWYHGAWDDKWTRLPNDALGTTHAPLVQLQLNPTTAPPSQVFDADLYTAYNDTLNPPDKFYNADLWRTLRACQLAIENLVTESSSGQPSSLFVPPVASWEGAASITPFTRATFFQWLAAHGTAGWDVQTGTTGALDNVGGTGGIDVSGFSFPRYPVNSVYFAVVNADGSISRAGSGSLDRAGHLNWDLGAFSSGDTGGKTIVISRGWDRKYPYEFLYMWDKQCWIPSPDTGGGAHTPPSSSFPGTWNFRGHSTAYKEHDGVGIVNDSNSWLAFQAGDLARHGGDNYNDPAIHPELSSSDTTGYASFYANFYEGQVSAAHQPAQQALLAGTVTASDTFYIEDSGKNWWPGGFYDRTSIADLGGTATGEDAAQPNKSLKDTAKATNGLFRTNTRGMLGFVVEVTIGGTVYRRRISAHPADGANLYWNEPLPSTATGNLYQVRWPKYEVNRWQGRTLHLIYPDGSTQDVTIQANDDQRLFFTPALAAAPPVGTTYQIQEIYPGGVWQRDATNTKWIQPVNPDARTGQSWHARQTEDQPPYRSAFGKAMKGDYPDVHFWLQLQDALNALVHVWDNFNWDGNPAPGHANYFYGLSTGQNNFDESGYPPSHGAQFLAKQTYAGSGTGPDNNNPFAAAYSDYNCVCYSYGVGRRYGWGAISLNTAQCFQSCAVDSYVWADVPNDLASGGSGTDTNATCPHIFNWDAQGDGVLYKLWHRFDTLAPSNANTRTTSVPLGSSTVPNDIGAAPTNCSGGPNDCDEFSGYVVKNWKIIKRYNVAGGFNFQ